MIAAQILKSSVEGTGAFDNGKEDAVKAALEKVSQGGPAAVLYMVALAVLYRFTNKYTTLMLVAAGAIAGQFIFD
jgi:hypothetical protein